MTGQSTNESLFTYLNKKAEEWKKQMDLSRAKRPKPIDPYKEKLRHEYNKQQGML